MWFQCVLNKSDLTWFVTVETTKKPTGFDLDGLSIWFWLAVWITPCNATGTSCHHFCRRKWLLWITMSRVWWANRFLFQKTDKHKIHKIFQQVLYLFGSLRLSGWQWPWWPLPLAHLSHTHHPNPRQGKVKYVNWVEVMLDALTWNIKYTSRRATTKTMTRVLYTRTPPRQRSELSSGEPGEPPS